MKTVDLSLDIYSKQNIELARDAYKNISKTVVVYRENYAKLRFLFCKYTEEKTVKEFENYLIGLENS